MPAEPKTNDPYVHLRILTMKQVSELTTYTPQHIYRLQKAGKFPKRISMGLNRIGFRLADIEKWMAERPTIEASLDDECDPRHV